MDATTQLATTQLIDRDRRYLVHPLHHPDDHRQPLVVVEGKGAMLYDAGGSGYIDGLSGLWNVNVGHGRGELADVAAAQMRRIAFASAYIGATNEPAVRLAEKIVGHAYANSAAVYFTTAGAESERIRLQIRPLLLEGQRQAGQDQDHLAHPRLSRGDHGGDERDRHGRLSQDVRADGAGLRPGRSHPTLIAGKGNAEPGLGAAEAVEQAILAEGADTVAAVIAEPVMGAGGVIVPPPSYFPALREICDRHDILLIADEVITGFGRTGRWFALGHWGVEPDLVSFAKGVTSGYLPLGGVIASKRVHEAIESAPADRKFMHAATYSGHPVCCAVGLRNVEIIEEEGLVERAAIMGKRLLAGLRRAARPAGGRRCARARHDVRDRAGGQQGHQGAGPRARPQDHPRGDGAGPPAADARGQRRPGDRRHDLPRPAVDDPDRDHRPHPRDPARRNQGGDRLNPQTGQGHMTAASPDRSGECRSPGNPRICEG